MIAGFNQRRNFEVAILSAQPDSCKVEILTALLKSRCTSVFDGVCGGEKGIRTPFDCARAIKPRKMSRVLALCRWRTFAIVLKRKSGGEEGIRTLETIPRLLP